MNLDLLSIFGAGLLTLLTPCILPMIPVYLALLLGAGLDKAREPRARFRLVGASALFVAGFSTVFTLLGLGASSVGATLQQHRSLMLLVGGALIVLFGLKYLGVLRLPWLDRTAQLGTLRTGSKGLDAFVFGLVFALGWTPCVGPILGSVLTYTAATTSSMAIGALYLLAYSLGVGLPLLALSVLADRLVPQLRKLHRHLRTFEKVTGGLMVAVGLLLVIPNIADRIRASVEAVDASHGVANQNEPIEPALGVPSPRPRLVEFHAKRCPVCERMAPKMEQLRDDCGKRGVDILTIDVSDPRNAHLVAQFGIQAVPTIKLFDTTGRETAQLFGERSVEELRAAAAGLTDTTCAGVKGIKDFRHLKANPACDTAPSDVGEEWALEVTQCAVQ